MKKIRESFLFVVLILLLAGCGSQGSADAVSNADSIKAVKRDYKKRTKDTGLDIQADNSVNLDSLDMPAYTLQELNAFFPKYSWDEIRNYGIESAEMLMLETVNEYFPVQVMRNNEEIRYSIYKVKEGGYYYVIWGVHYCSQHGIFESFVADTMYMNALRECSDFDSLIIGESTYADLNHIDPASDITLTDPRGIYSFSLLKERKLLRVEYEGLKTEGQENLVIKSKEIVTPEEYPATFLVYILPQDIPWTRDEMGRADKFAPQNPAKNGATAAVKEAAAFPNVKIDNSTDLETLDMPEYPLWALELFFKDLWKIKRLKDGSDAIAHTVEEVNQKFPIQIVRKNANAYYAIFKVKEGGYYYVFFTDAYEIYKGLDLQGLAEVGIVPVGEKKTVSDTYYIRELRKKKDFELLKAGTSTYTDVRAIDSSNSLRKLPKSRFIYSYSLLEEREIMKIEYSVDKSKNKNELIVKKIEQVKIDEEYPMINMAAILSADLP